MRITISGHPLPGTLAIVGAIPDETIYGEGWLLNPTQAMHLLDLWKHAPTGDGDAVRDWAYSDSSVFVTALYLDGELGMAVWDSATGSDGTDLYSTTTMPFDFDICADDGGRAGAR